MAGLRNAVDNTSWANGMNDLLEEGIQTPASNINVMTSQKYVPGTGGKGEYKTQHSLWGVSAKRDGSRFWNNRIADLKKDNLRKAKQFAAAGRRSLGGASFADPTDLDFGTDLTPTKLESPEEARKNKSTEMTDFTKWYKENRPKG